MTTVTGMTENLQWSFIYIFSHISISSYCIQRFNTQQNKSCIRKKQQNPVDISHSAVVVWIIDPKLVFYVLIGQLGIISVFISWNQFLDV